MNIPIDTFELHFSDNSLLKGEKLFDENKINGASKVDKNLWTSSIQDGSPVEVELYLTPKSLKKATCDCTGFKQNKECEHLVATLFWIRKYISKEKKTSNSKSNSPKHTTLSTTLILNELNKNELIEYVKSVVRSNKDLANDLKLKYAHKIQYVDAQSKYSDILNAVFRPHVSKGHISANQIKSLFKLVLELLDQAVDFAALKQYEESVFAGLGAIHKINYLYGKISEEKKELYANQMIISYEKMFFILKQDLAPKLRRTANKDLEELATSSYYQWVDVKMNYLTYLCEHVWNKTKRDHFIKKILPSLTKNSSDDRKTLFLSLAISLNSVENMTGELIKDLKTMEVPVFRKIYQNLLHSHPETIGPLCQKTLTHTDNWRLQKYCFNLLIQDPINDVLILPVLPKIYNLLAFTADQNMAEWLVHHDPKIHNKVDDLLKVIAKRQNKTKANRLATYFYFHLKKYDQLVQLLSQNLKIEYFEIFTPKLLKENHELLLNIYLSAIENFLDSHLGNQAYDQASDLIHYLDRKHARTIKKAVQELVQEKYSHRKGLTKQIAPL